MVWYEQTEPGSFQPRSLADIPCDYITLELGDVDGDGRTDIILGNFGQAREGVEWELVQIWRQRP